MSAANFLELSIVIEGQIGPDASRQCDVFSAEPRSSSNLSPSSRRISRARPSSTSARADTRPGLNFGDSFAYALAKITGEPLLFKGEDFKKTDILSAL